MAQLQLPIFHQGVNLISNDIGYEKSDGKIVYFRSTNAAKFFRQEWNRLLGEVHVVAAALWAP